MEKKEMKSKTSVVLTTFAVTFLLSLTIAAPVLSVPPPPAPWLDPNLIPKFVEPLLIPPVYQPTLSNSTHDYYEISMETGVQQVLPTGFPTTPIWGYNGTIVGGSPWISQPGATFEASRGRPIVVKWINNIATPHLFPVDPSLHWADPNGLDYHMNPPATWDPYPPGYTLAQTNVPTIPHLHGGEVQSTSDGHPDAWFTATGDHGTAYNTINPADTNAATFLYPNEQPPATLWYHDHALGITRINVMSGLAGFYLLRDGLDANNALLPSGEYDVPIVIQDRTFYPDGRFWFPTVGVDPIAHPYWQPEFFGNTIMVNGKTWPYFDVAPAIYRLRLLDGSNARFYDLKLVDPLTGTAYPFYQISTDGGYLTTPVKMNKLTIAPGERADILVDFRGLPPNLVLMNGGKTPYPNGAPTDPNTGMIMQFRVTLPAPVGQPATIPVALSNPSLTPLPVPTNTRILTLTEVMGPLGPLMALLNGQLWGATISEDPAEGSTEEWVIINLTGDTHPIHLHLVQFQVMSRQKINAAKYEADWHLLNAGGSLTGMPPWDNTWTVQELDPTAYLRGRPKPPKPNEMGWKDTVQMNPGEVTIIRARFSPIDGSGSYSFDPADGPGYVWHCHILDHEDNEMMRPYIVLP